MTKMCLASSSLTEQKPVHVTVYTCGHATVNHFVYDCRVIESDNRCVQCDAAPWLDLAKWLAPHALGMEGEWELAPGVRLVAFVNYHDGQVFEVSHDVLLEVPAGRMRLDYRRF